MKFLLAGLILSIFLVGVFIGVAIRPYYMSSYDSNITVVLEDIDSYWLLSENDNFEQKLVDNYLSDYDVYCEDEDLGNPTVIHELQFEKKLESPVFSVIDSFGKSIEGSVSQSSSSYSVTSNGDADYIVISFDFQEWDLLIPTLSIECD